MIIAEALSLPFVKQITIKTNQMWYAVKRQINKKNKKRQTVIHTNKNKSKKRQKGQTNKFSMLNSFCKWVINSSNNFSFAKVA